LDHPYISHCLRSHLLRCCLRLLFAFLGLTLFATAAVGPDGDALPDAPSAVIVQSFHDSAPDVQKAEVLFPDARSAEAATEQHNHLSVLRRALQDQKEIYESPFHRRNLKWDLVIVAATGGLIAGDKHISGSLSRDHVDLSQHISDVGLYSMTASVAGLWFFGRKTQDAHANGTGILTAEAFGNTAAVVGLMQLIAGRERPTEGVGNGRFWHNNAFGSSFPSAHSSFTWTMASVVAHEYPKPWVRWLVYSTATTVSMTRMTGLKHFPSDVAVGGAFGYLVGQHIFNAHHRPHFGSRPSSRKSVNAEK